MYECPYRTFLISILVIHDSGCESIVIEEMCVFYENLMLFSMVRYGTVGTSYLGKKVRYGHLGSTVTPYL